MTVNPKRGNGGHVTSYTVNIGSKEARDCGFVDKDGNRYPIKKTVEPENHRIIIELDTEQKQ